MERGHGRSPYLLIHAAMVYSYLYAPIVVLIAYSFNKSKRNAIWTGFTLDWYRELMANTEVLSALGKSLEVALASTAIATVLGTLSALALARYRFRAKSAYTTAIYVPMVTPEVVMGVALLTLFVAANVTLSLTTVILAHAAFSTSFVTVVVRARLAGYDRTLDEAAADLGANPLEVFFRVTLPLILPGIVAGALLAFTISLDDFVISFFNSGAGATTLPIKVYSMIKFGVSPVINCASTVMLALTLSLMLFSHLMERRHAPAGARPSERA